MLNAQIWHFLAGLGFFLFAMNMLESLLKNTSGRKLKLFLKKQTRNLFKAITGGALVTGVVQSSSVVSLIVLAFVESGIISFRNALGVILGSNLGTTLSSWIVATIGFKVDILSFTLPIIAVSTIGMFSFEKRKNIYNFFSVLFSIGILFLGLNFMKEGALELVKEFDLAALASYGAIIYVLIGFVLSSIIQSSSATVAIALTAIYSGILPLQSAAALVIGTEVGTTMKILLWGMKGSVDKKRVAYGNFIYNIFTAVLAFIILDWLLGFIVNTLMINDKLIALVFFQSSINLISIIIFVPFLKYFSGWLEKTIRKSSGNAGSYISGSLPSLPMLATDTLKNEASNLLARTMAFNKMIFTLPASETGGLFRNIQAFAQTSVDMNGEYIRLKQTEGDILSYYAGLQSATIEEASARQMLQYVNAARQAIYAAKSVKDIEHNLRQFVASTNNILHRQPIVIQHDWMDFDAQVQLLMHESDISLKTSRIENLLENVILSEEKQKQEVIRWLKKEYLNELEASTYLNMSREILASKKAILGAVATLESGEIETGQIAAELPAE
jgi:phosphate:Na+ symporter